MPAAATEASASQAWILQLSAESTTQPVRAFGLSPGDRLARSLARTGVARVETVGADALLAREAPTRSVVFRSDYFYDERLVAALLATDDTMLCTATDDGQPDEALAVNVAGAHLETAVNWLRSQSGAGTGAGTRAPSDSNRTDSTRAASSQAGEFRRVVPTDLVPAYNAQLRKHDPPFVYPAKPETLRETENRIFAASYKGITDFITKHVWPLPARAVVRVLAQRGVRPNSVTAVGYLLTALAIGLFMGGYFTTGLLAGWLMTFLDTVDGKLARVTLTSSKLGGALDHGLDLVHPPIWWWAWAVGLGLSHGADGFSHLGDDPMLAIGMWIIVWGYLVGRILEGIFLALFGMEIFTWQRFDSFFRGIIARRNPNLLILSLGLGFGRPDWAYSAVALWTLVCIGVVGARILQAFARRRSGDPIRPWHEEQAQTT